MKMLDANSTLADLVLEVPSRSDALETLGVNYCCGGEKPLVEVCKQRGLEPRSVIGLLDAEGASGEEGELNLGTLTLHELCDLMEQRHQKDLARLLKELQRLMNRVTEARGRLDPRLRRMDAVFKIFAGELEAQMRIERRKLFPLARALERGAGAESLLALELETVCQELGASRSIVANALSIFRGLSNGFNAPDGACSEVRRLYDGMRELSSKTRLHAHARNNALLPKARAVANQRLPKGGNQNET